MSHGYSKTYLAIMLTLVISVPVFGQSLQSDSVSEMITDNLSIISQGSAQVQNKTQQAQPETQQAQPQTQQVKPEKPKIAPHHSIRKPAKVKLVKKVINEPAIAVVEKSTTIADFLFGEVNVSVVGNQNPVIKLGMSPNGATIIEFPATDKLFNIIPGNSNLVTVEESETKESDRFIIVRPGDGFASPTVMAGARRNAAASVMVQFTSGLVVTFVFYPVPKLIEQAHRVVLSYNRNEVIAARRAAGLMTNLESPTDAPPKRNMSMRVSSQSHSGLAETAHEVSSQELSKRPESNLGKQQISSQSAIDFDSTAAYRLEEALKAPIKLKWSKSAHGLKLAAFPVQEIDRNVSQVVIAILNDGKNATRLLPDNPEITVTTTDNKDKNVQTEPIKKLAVKTNSVDGIVPAQAVRFYSLVYEAPILGAKQELRVSAAQRHAADEPVTMILKDFAGPSVDKTISASVKK